MRTFTILLSLAFVSTLALGDTPTATENKQNNENQASNEHEHPTSFWMQRKMTYAQEILRGLASADFQAIGTNARQMRTLSKVEGFVRSRNPNYRTQLHAFESVCDEMIQHAEEKNLPGVTLAFNQMTVSCVSCHQTLRVTATDSNTEKAAP